MSEYKIRVTTVDQKVGIFQVARNKTVLDLKNIIAPTFETSVDRLKLIYAGRVLRNETILSDILNDVTDLVTFHLVISILNNTPLSSSAPVGRTFSQLAPVPRPLNASPSSSALPPRTITSLNPDELSQRERAQHLVSNYQRLGRTAGIHGIFPNMIQRIESSGLTASGSPITQSQDSNPNYEPSSNDSSRNPFMQPPGSQQQTPTPNPTTTTTTSVTSVPNGNVTMVVSSSVQGRTQPPHIPHLNSISNPIPNVLPSPPFHQNNGVSVPQASGSHAIPSSQENFRQPTSINNFLQSNPLHGPPFVRDFSSPSVSNSNIPQRQPNENPRLPSMVSGSHMGSPNFSFMNDNSLPAGGSAADAPQLLSTYYQPVLYNGSFYLQQLPFTSSFPPLPYQPLGLGAPPVLSPYGIIQNQQTGECAYLLSPTSDHSSLQAQPMALQSLRRFQRFTSSVLSPFTHTYENIRRHFRLFIRLALFCAWATYNDSLPQTMLLTSIMAFVFLLQTGALNPVFNENQTFQAVLEYIRNVQNEYRQRRSRSNPEIVEVPNAAPSENQEDVASEAQRRRTDTETTRAQRFFRSARDSIIAFASSFVPRS
ncbi:hypothetical protein SPOG_04005 [Schizosaccharomyces cryophilus OY26]|uniref:Ubiquitin-like domain-containing protein n=1 Tax=Schizosaccharomyces cryophilus (strain OY26 / ATCC MYA-4695 / CBS 11777 / NBRC 106824 / NRRL Y48691) TaxID=653667 RepID=S9XAC5_SCHCR|nr:uncharacterized protein SPOG_04005 [Schizosaccharomyces cryophilus OY26]EPY54112.1 hypothetical protein SPOG_04005 [Schizosaccharomyces cryophilus OY26]